MFRGGNFVNGSVNFVLFSFCHLYRYLLCCPVRSALIYDPELCDIECRAIIGTDNHKKYDLKRYIYLLYLLSSGPRLAAGLQLFFNRSDNDNCATSRLTVSFASHFSSVERNSSLPNQIGPNTLEYIEFIFFFLVPYSNLSAGSYQFNSFYLKVFLHIL